MNNMNTIKYSSAVIYVPRPGSFLAHTIEPGSGIVGVINGHGQLMIDYEGNRIGAENLETPENRVIHAFGRASTQYPTVARSLVTGDQLLDLIRVGSIQYPDAIAWDSDWSERIFRDYAGQSAPAPSPGRRESIATPSLVEVFLPGFMAPYEKPESTQEWRWIQAMASFEHIGNDVQPGVYEFVLRVRTGKEGDEYESPPPARLGEILTWARQRGHAYVLFHQG